MLARKRYNFCDYMKFSKDPRVYLVPLSDFLKKHRSFFENRPMNDSDLDEPLPWTQVYRFLPDKIVAIEYGSTATNFGTEIKAAVDFIEVAMRDGITEYEVIDERIAKCKSELKKDPNSRNAQKRLRDLRRFRKSVPPFEKRENIPPKPFSDYLVQTGQKSESSLANDYVVLDVETNGLRWTKDDLLSISLYSPKSGVCYNRFLPLDQQPVVLTGWINGITTETLSGEAHITQEEFDSLIREFSLNKVTILCYSGGDGSFDIKFLSNYCERHGIVGCENLKFENIKNYLPTPGYGTEGQCTKDNLCRILGIDGVSDIHSGLNDCLLEWKLFESLKTRKVFFIQNHMYEYKNDYIVPVSYLIAHTCLARFAGFTIPSIYGEATEVYSYTFPRKLLSKIRKFSTNITGITVESALNSLLGAQKQDNSVFLIKNKMKLTYLGSLEKNITEIPVIEEIDGTFRTTDARFASEVDIVNSVTQIIKTGLATTADFIRKQIFNDQPIMSQEMVLGENGKVLALCDLSNKTTVLELKTHDVLSRLTLEGKPHLKPELSLQLYYQSKGRKAYAAEIVLDVDYSCDKGDLFSKKIRSLGVRIFEVSFRRVTQEEKKTVRISDWFRPYFDVIKTNPNCTYLDFMTAMDVSRKCVQRDLQYLKALGYVEKKGSRAYGNWVILKEPLFWDPLFRKTKEE